MRFEYIARKEHDSVQFAIGVPGFQHVARINRMPWKRTVVFSRRFRPDEFIYLSPGLTVYALRKPSAALDCSTRATALSKP